MSNTSAAQLISTTEQTYQDAVKRLTAENRQLREAASEAKRAHREEVQVLTVQLNEGLSAELIALRREVHKWRDRALAAEARKKATRR